MRFGRTKVGAEKLKQFRKVSSSAFEPFTILLTPIYVHLPKNKKLLAVKAPLGVFFPDDLKKLSQFKDFYLPQFVDVLLPFQNAGNSIRSVFSLVPKVKIKSSKGPEVLELTPTPAEIDDAVLRILGPLWGKDKFVEPYFLNVFASSLCDPLSPKTLESAASKNLEDLEIGLLHAGLYIFFALHLGCHGVKELSNARQLILDGGSHPLLDSSLLNLVRTLIPNTETKRIPISSLESFKSKTAKKLLGRLKRVQDELLKNAKGSATIFGPKGLADE